MAEVWRGRRLTTVVLWRWRRSPLRRTSDLVEAWVLLAAWVLAVVGGAVVGAAMAVVADRALEGERGERREIAAVVVSTGSAGASTRFGDAGRAWAEVEWTAPDGRTRTGRTNVSAEARVGSRVPIWTDVRGDLRSRPAHPSEALLEAIVVGVLAAAATGGAVWACTRVVRGLLDGRRMRQWAAQWECIQARWGGRTS
ncbi:MULTISPECIES: hypothetical protein [unclassified Streptomyces]|uniref:Rv1733c family protein n=1 Tax=unclassified Streptomyces TaxID=2593676 RepID=UPI0029AED58A|nr:hypothetical protein [Streptomyces sp. AK02-04a]MDX3758015.1 hypothetical protein [Streptomyces sp. AK02-04a]